MQDNIAIKLQNISKTYKLYDKPIDRLKEALHPLKRKYHKNFYALNNLNLEVKKGEVLGIVGINGAGKSTLLKIISGVMTPTAGIVKIDGKINAILELGSGLKPEMTGRDNIKLNLHINGITKNQERVTDEIVEFADLGEHINQPVKTYSTGMKARLGFGIATSTDPDILIIDEVLAVGDIIFRRKCFARIEKLFNDGKTVIFVSHSAQSIIEFCSRAILLFDKEIVMDDSPKKVTNYYQKLVFSKNNDQILTELKNKNHIGINEDEVKISEEQKFKFNKNEEWFNDSLVVEPKIIDNSNIKITTTYLLDENNLAVNKLVTNKKYKIYVKAEMGAVYDNLSFGVAISNVKGVSLSCTREYIHQPVLENVSGKYNIEFYWGFKCVFLDGKFFVKINFRHQDDELLTVVSDALIFEVESIKMEHQYRGCIVDLQQGIEKEIKQ